MAQWVNGPKIRTSPSKRTEFFERSRTYKAPSIATISAADQNSRPGVFDHRAQQGNCPTRQDALSPIASLCRQPQGPTARGGRAMRGRGQERRRFCQFHSMSAFPSIAGKCARAIGDPGEGVGAMWAVPVLLPSRCRGEVHNGSTGLAFRHVICSRSTLPQSLWQMQRVASAPPLAIELDHAGRRGRGRSSTMIGLLSPRAHRSEDVW
jgi:hypothetical protein